ncbi:MAG: aminopeptidase P family protein [Alphaproteobacteria bacterium]|nr:aminopeptidase P family protein [Alphaproteobacteria bacterium]
MHSIVQWMHHSQMIQNNTQLPTPAPFSDRLQDLRAQFRKLDLDGYLVPMSDAYQNEYVARSERRIKFISGFTGTSGFVIVLIDRAAFFTDSRYTIQAEDQIPPDLFEVYNVSQKTPNEWLCANLRSKMKIGFDPKLHSGDQVKKLEIVALKHGASLVPVEQNLIDSIWVDRPEATLAPIVMHDTIYAGKSSSLKRHEIANTLQQEGLNAALITDPASIAWLLNVRGGDVPYTPLPLSTAILRADGTVEWFVDPAKITAPLERGLGTEVTRYAPSDFPSAAKRLGEANSRVLVDSTQASFHIISLLDQCGAHVSYGDNPCILPKACKNTTEIDGMRAAHRRDGAAVVKLLVWLDEQAHKGTVSELDVDKKLTDFRSNGSLYRGASFATIVGSGPNGAIVHYRVNQSTNRVLDQNSFLLLDSGAQYLDGTTDITRTIPLGEITSEMKDRYTRVLKGHIALASIRFPEGTSGADLDVLARQYLWKLGLNYGHGTGHGVGCYLGVHEGPHSISRSGKSPFHIGMVTSNEPGYYKARHYGIRLENLQHVIELFEISSPECKMLGFEPLTLVPFDRRAIDEALMTREEKAWLNAYHARVHKALRPQLDETAGQWLANACKTL